MEMRACEDIDDIGEDLTSQIPPLAFSLYDPFLLSHCSSCFLPLPKPPHFPPFLPNNPINPHPIPIHYCSSNCSTSDSHRHLSSGETHLFFIIRSQPTTWTGDTSDLRAALRLLLHFEDLKLLLHHPHHYDRICGLMSNHEKLVLEGENEILERIKEGGRLMGMARRMRNGDEMKDDNLVEEIVFCQVLTNAVEVQINEQGSLGIAIYGPDFSWINHSCSPNACYRFPVSGSELEKNYHESKLRIFASGEGNVLKTWVCDEKKLYNGNSGYGPRIIVRSIKPIKKGKEICISYTDLLQPKATRHSELWSKYRFSCCCWRCSASPPTYLDRVLTENAAAQLEESNSCSDDNINENEAYEELTECMDDIISDYISDGNPESCCEKLESVLTQSLHEEKPEALLLPNFKLHPLHHLSLNAYITLASAYKIRANNVSACCSGTDDHMSEVVELSKTSAAYYFLLAGVTQHLFLSERSLIASAAHFWISAGESLLNLVRNLVWNSSLNPQPSFLVLSSPPDNRWKKCMLMEKLEMNLVSSQSQSKSRQREFEEISKSFIGCLSKILPQVWAFLIHGHHYLKYIKDPIDFSWLEITKNHILEESQALLGSSTGVGSSYFGRSSCYCGCEAGEGIDKQKTGIVQLGVHCLVYGGYLASICYSRDCYLTAYVRNLLSQLDKQACR